MKIAKEKLITQIEIFQKQERQRRQSTPQRKTEQDKKSNSQRSNDEDDPVIDTKDKGPPLSNYNESLPKHEL